MKVELLTFPGCPAAAPTRAALVEAMRRVGVSASIEELDPTVAHTPAHARGWASPTILIDGVELEGLSRREEAVACRFYDGPDRAPRLELIERALQRGKLP